MSADIYVMSANELEVNGLRYQCTIGKDGFVAADAKREGDNKTPIGIYPLRKGMYRADKHDDYLKDLYVISPRDGWCDDPSHEKYNRPVVVPFDASHEKLWHKEDDCYDVIVPIGYNDDPITPGMGSAIFFHIAHPDYRGTEGCVAVSKEDMFEILPQLNAESRIHILPNSNE